MPRTTLSSRELNQDVGRAKKAADRGPVVITDRGRPAYVLTTFGDYAKTQDKGLSLLQALALPEEDDVDLDDFLPRGAYYDRYIDLD